jgi:hypothetical protein
MRVIVFSALDPRYQAQQLYPKLTFAASCLTVREGPIREENVEVLAKKGNTHAETTI